MWYRKCVGVAKGHFRKGVKMLNVKVDLLINLSLCKRQVNSERSPIQCNRYGIYFRGYF